MNKNSLNQVVLIGRMGMAPEQRSSTSGMIIANISIATTISKKVEFSEDWTEETEWHKCVAFGKTAEHICKYGDKGRLCNIIGRLQTRKWVDQKGVDHYTTSIIVEQFQFLDKRDQSYRPGEQPKSNQRSVYPEQEVLPDPGDDNAQIDEEELPF